MNEIGKIAGGIGLLVALYLIVVDYQGTASVISSIASATTGTVKTLQGR